MLYTYIHSVTEASDPNSLFLNSINTKDSKSTNLSQKRTLEIVTLKITEHELSRLQTILSHKFLILTTEDYMRTNILFTLF